MAAPGLFDFRNALIGSDAVNGTKNNILATNDPEVLKAFEPFMIRRSLAQEQDILVVAEMMNLLHSTDKWMQWCYAFYSIPARKRYTKWSKKSPDNPDILLLCDYYQISPEKAADYLRIFTEDQMNTIRTMVANQNNDVKSRKTK